MLRTSALAAVFCVSSALTAAGLLLASDDSVAEPDYLLSGSTGLRVVSGMGDRTYISKLKPWHFAEEAAVLRPT